MNKKNILLTIILIWLQYSLWFGKNGIYDYLRISNSIAEHKIINSKLKIRNINLLIEINDLDIGHEAIEERARNELGMIKNHETFYRFIQSK